MSREAVHEPAAALSRFPSGRAQASDQALPAVVHDVLRAPGDRLDDRTRAFMEPRFGHDFSAVRVHADAEAARSASAVGALAYTVGQHVVFGPGRYAPDALDGRALLAHELVHTIQQANAGTSTLAARARVSEPGDADEREAEAVSARVLGASSPPEDEPCVRCSGAGIQRLGDLTKVPPGLACEVASDSPPAPVDSLLYANDVSALSGPLVAQIATFLTSWRAAGATAPVRVDGYASERGTDEHNWTLSCDRATAVAAELSAPSGGGAGVPAALIRTVAQGETAEFGAEAANRRVTIASSLAAPTPPAPPPACANPGSARTLDLQPIFLRTDPADAAPTGASWTRRLASANVIWGKLGVTFNDLGAIVIDSALKTRGDTVAERASIRALRSGAGVEVFVVDNDLATAGGADTLPTIGAGCGANGNIVMSDRGASDTLLAHELGHILGLDHPGQAPPFNAGDAGTIMEPSGSNTAANPTRNTMVNFGRILCPPATGSICLSPDP
jgi:outer membrane protein OmpA-like peptidoglycan-associated protein